MRVVSALHQDIIVFLAREDAALDAQLLDAAHRLLSEHIEWHDGVLVKVIGLCERERKRGGEGGEEGKERDRKIDR